MWGIAILYMGQELKIINPIIRWIVVFVCCI